MTTSAILCRKAESLGFVIFWYENGYYFAPQGHEQERSRWSALFEDLDDCAYAAISEAEQQLATFYSSYSSRGFPSGRGA